MSTTTTQDLATIPAMPTVSDDSALIVFGVGQTSVATNPAFIQRRDDLLEQASSITAIADDFTEAEAVEVIRGLKAIGSEVEKSRKAIKRPFIDLNALIETTANVVREDVDRAVTRIQPLLDNRAREKYLAAQKAERERQEAIAKAERERAAAVKAQEEARLAKEAAERAAIAAREKAERDAKEAAKLAEMALAPAQAEEDKPFEPIVMPAPEPVSTPVIVPPTPQETRALSKEVQRTVQAEIEVKATKPVEATTAVGTKVQEKWEGTVIDAAALYAARPDFVGLVPKLMEIRKFVDGGGRELAGVEIKQVVNYKVGR